MKTGLIFSLLLGLASACFADGSLLFSDSFDYPNGSIPDASSPWDVTSGVMNSDGQTAQTNSGVFRVITDRTDFKDASVSFDFLNQGLTNSSGESWHGSHIFLRYQSQYHLYALSFNRRDNVILVKKKMPGGSSNGGTYYNIGASKSYPTPYNNWQKIKATIQTNSNGSVTIQLFSGSQMLLSVTDTGIGGSPIKSAGKVGIRSDYDKIKFDNFAVNTLTAVPAEPPPVSVVEPPPDPGNTNISPLGSKEAVANQKFLSPSLADGFNDSAVFGPEAQEVRIFDIRGREVFHATHQGNPIVWTCRDEMGQVVESGVYIAKIHKKDSGTIHQKFAVVK